MRIGCPYHQQDEFGYCGAAVAMMAALRPEAALKAADMSQRLLFLKSFDIEEPWGTTPARLADLLNLNAKLPSGLSYEVRCFKSSSEATRQIVASIEATRLPALVPWKGYHWVLIDGFDIDVEGAVRSLAVLRPVELSPCKKPPPPHDEGDDGCAAGAPDDGEHNFSMQTWLKLDYVASEFTQRECQSGILAIVAGPHQGEERRLSNESPFLPSPAPAPAAEFRRFTWTPDDDAIADIVRQLPEEQRGRWEGVTDTTWLPVEGIGVPGSPDYGDYWLVAVQRGGGRVGWLLGNPTGQRSTSALSARSEPRYEEILSPEQAAATAMRFLGIEGGVTDDRLVWRLSRESRSPQLPFWSVRFDGIPNPVYVRVDGRAFVELTRPRPGG